MSPVQAPRFGARLQPESSRSGAALVALPAADSTCVAHAEILAALARVSSSPWSRSSSTAASALVKSGMVLSVSALVHASQTVPPKSAETMAMGTFNFSCSSRPKKNPTALKSLAELESQSDQWPSQSNCGDTEKALGTVKRRMLGKSACVNSLSQLVAPL